MDLTYTQTETNIKQFAYTRPKEALHKLKQTPLLKTTLPSKLGAFQFCPNDVLFSISKFLSLRDLLPILHSCRRWYSVASKQPSRQLALMLNAGIIKSLRTSPLIHHINQLTLFEKPTLDDLKILRTLPKLTSLNIDPDEADLHFQLTTTNNNNNNTSREQNAQIFRDAMPKHLHKLTISFRHVHFTSCTVRQAIVDSLDCQTHLSDLKLDWLDQQSLDYSSLTKISRLNKLYTLDRISTAQFPSIKKLNSLTILHVGSGCWGSKDIMDLFIGDEEDNTKPLRQLKEITVSLEQQNFHQLSLAFQKLSCNITVINIEGTYTFQYAHVARYILNLAWSENECE